MKVLRAVAYLIFDALDFGNNYLNEPALHNSLENLLILMSGKLLFFVDSTSRKRMKEFQ